MKAYTDKRRCSKSHKFSVGDGVGVKLPPFHTPKEKLKFSIPSEIVRIKGNVSH